MSTRKKKPGIVSTSEKNEISVEEMKKDIESELKAKDTIEWSNMELERSVRAMEMNVLQLEAGNLDADDSEVKQRYENQKQLNVQLLEQKKWLEHELEQIKQKIQNEKMDLPDPFSFDWDNLSETELKRLVGQLEKTRSDLKSDLREMEWRLDKEGKDYHHHNNFCQMYQAEIKNLNRILETLTRTGLIPTGLQLFSSQSISQSSSYPSTGGQPTPGGGYGGHSSAFLAASRKPSSNPTGSSSPRRRPNPPQQPQHSPTRRNPSPTRKTVVDPKTTLPMRKVAQPRILPKIEKQDNSKNAQAELDPVEEDQEN